MSDTYRHCADGWGPGNPDFDRLFGDKCHSRKHQMKDRPPTNKKHRFFNGSKNSRFNLLRKNEEMSQKEEMEGY